MISNGIRHFTTYNLYFSFFFVSADTSVVPIVIAVVFHLKSHYVCFPVDGLSDCFPFFLSLFSLLVQMMLQ